MERRDPLVDILQRYGACPEGVVWAQGYHTLEQLWETCPHPAWMLWALEHFG